MDSLPAGLDCNLNQDKIVKRSQILVTRSFLLTMDFDGRGFRAGCSTKLSYLLLLSHLLGRIDDGLTWLAFNYDWILS